MIDGCYKLWLRCPTLKRNGYVGLFALLYFCGIAYNLISIKRIYDLTITILVY